MAYKKKVQHPLIDSVETNNNEILLFYTQQQKHNHVLRHPRVWLPRVSPLSLLRLLDHAHLHVSELLDLFPGLFEVVPPFGEEAVEVGPVLFREGSVHGRRHVDHRFVLVDFGADQFGFQHCKKRKEVNVPIFQRIII